MLFAWLIKEKKFVLFGESDGVIQNEYLSKPRLLSMQGDVYMGGVKGLLHINCKIPLTTSELPQLQLSDVIINGESVNNELTNRPTGISAPWNSNITIRIMSKEKDIFRQKVYRYQIEGLNDQQIESYNPELAIRSLPPGSYKIMASCTAKDGSWIPSQEVLELTILPPWYRTWWFILSCTVLTAAAIIETFRRTLKRKEEKLKWAMKEHEQQVYEEKVRFLINISHELRTPLTAIIGYIALMKKGNDADKKEQYVRNIRQSSDRMREMLNTLLSFFRLDNGKEQPNISPCRISAITHILETEFTPIAMNKGLALTITNQTGTVVLTDKERILQIGNNLLSNAIKFTDNGGVSLTTDYNNGVLKLIVEDTGTGMTEKEQQRVFVAFERLSNAAAKDGFGLGLSIVQRIVSILGGTIRLESEKGKGSRFTVEIPMQTAGELPERINQTRIHHDRTFHDVIAIDNDEVLLLMLKEMYAQEGIHCDTCTDAAELMEMIRRKEYSLLLTDLNMPEINGFELLELLRTSNVGNSKTIPVVVTTASGSCSKEELMELGFSGCLLKPFSISELMEVSDNYAMSMTQDEMPDFSTLLSYGNESVMLEKLITETEKEMQSVRNAEQRKDLQEMDALTHHLRSSWEILRTDQPLRKLYKLLHCDGTPDDKTIGNAIKSVLDKGSEIIRLAKEERKKYNNG